MRGGRFTRSIATGAALPNPKSSKYPWPHERIAWRRATISKHPRQVRAARRALVAHDDALLARAVGGDGGEPIGDLAVAAVILDQPADAVAALALAFRACHAKVSSLPSRSEKVTEPSRGMGCVISREGQPYRPYKIRKPRPLLRAGDPWSWQAVGNYRSIGRTGRGRGDPL